MMITKRYVLFFSLSLNTFSFFMASERPEHAFSYIIPPAIATRKHYKNYSAPIRSLQTHFRVPLPLEERQSSLIPRIEQSTPPSSKREAGKQPKRVLSEQEKIVQSLYNNYCLESEDCDSVGEKRQKETKRDTYPRKKKKSTPKRNNPRHVEEAVSAISLNAEPSDNCMSPPAINKNNETCQAPLSPDLEDFLKTLEECI